MHETGPASTARPSTPQPAGTSSPRASQSRPFRIATYTLSSDESDLPMHSPDSSMSTPLIAAYTGSAAARLSDTGGAAMPGTAIWRAWCASMAAAISADRSTPPTAALLPAALASSSQIGGPGPIIDSVLSLAVFAVAVSGEACRAEISSISSILHICSIAALASARAASTAALASRDSALACSKASAFACSVAPRFTSRWERGMGD
jgi:hypothetical protein